MKKTVIAAALVSLICAQAGWSRGERAGEFDYYVLALSWSPGWCASDGKNRNSEQCTPGKKLSFVMHGLWPNFERGYPSDCRTSQRDPSHAQTAAMADIMGTKGLAWYQWKKHGRCAGLSAEAYFSKARQAYEAITIPEGLKNLNKDVRLPASVVEEAFLEANPNLHADGVTVTCAQNRIDEVRICLNKDLSPRQCGRDIIRDCQMTDALMDAVR